MASRPVYNTHYFNIKSVIFNGRAEGMVEDTPTWLKYWMTYFAPKAIHLTFLAFCAGAVCAGAWCAAVASSSYRNTNTIRRYKIPCSESDWNKGNCVDHITRWIQNNQCNSLLAQSQGSIFFSGSGQFFSVLSECVLVSSDCILHVAGVSPL